MTVSGQVNKGKVNRQAQEVGREDKSIGVPWEKNIARWGEKGRRTGGRRQKHSSQELGRKNRQNRTRGRRRKRDGRERVVWEQNRKEHKRGKDRS